MKNFQKHFNTITNVLILSLLVFGGLVWADTNGVWHLTEDIRGGVFAEDEQDVTTDFTFIHPVNFFDNLTRAGITINDTTITFPDTSIQNGAMPSGIIAMFDTDCPIGWSDYLPLQNKFPRGQANSSGNDITSGGSDDAIVVRHDHDASSGDDSHGHDLNGGTTTGGSSMSRSEHYHRFSVSGSISGGDGSFSDSGSTSSARGGTRGDHAGKADTHSHDHSIDVRNEGESGVDKNIPAYQEVVFCKKD